VLFNHITDKMLIQCHLRAIYLTIYLCCVVDPMIQHLEDLLFKLTPCEQSRHILLLSYMESDHVLVFVDWRLSVVQDAWLQKHQYEIGY